MGTRQNLLGEMPADPPEEQAEEQAGGIQKASRVGMMDGSFMSITTS